MSGRLPSYPMRAVHLTAVWAYGVTAPALSLVEGNQELFVGPGVTRLDAVIVMLLIALVPPLVATTYAWLASLASRWAGDVVYLAFLGAFVVPLALQLVKYLDPGVVLALLFPVAICVGCAVLYSRARVVRSFVGFSIVLPIIGLLLFAQGLPPLSGEAEAATSVTVRTPQPVVMLVFDELPVSSLLAGDGTIDAVRYPNFARLAKDGTWYPNATTVHDSTTAAIPALLTGKDERVRSLPIAFNYPDNLFTLLAEDYTLDVRESGTRLCPMEECPQYETATATKLGGFYTSVKKLLLVRMVPVSLWGLLSSAVDFDAVHGKSMERSLGEFESYLEEIETDTSRETLHYAHMLVPHRPWRFLPSGTEYAFEDTDGLVGGSDYWEQDPWLVLQAYQRHLLQVGYADAVLGRLLVRLDRTGLYDRALVVVVADHGVGFTPGASPRWASEANIHDVANVPLFLKIPHQHRGRVDRRAARLVDVLPTIGDVLGIRLPWRVDGASLLDAPVKRSTVSIKQRNGILVEAPLAEMIRHRESAVREKVEHFGEGDDPLFAIGKSVDLLDTVVPDDPASTDTRVGIEDRGEFEDVRPGSGFVPARITGVVTGGAIEPGTELAVAVNGRIRALTFGFPIENPRHFRAIVPESAFGRGFNRIDVFAVTGAGEKRLLTWLGSNGDPR